MKDILIISLGMNCEVSSRLQFYYGKISSYPFSWSKINDREFLIDCLNNDFKDLLTGDISIQEPGMLRFSRYDMGFHVTDKNGILVKSLSNGLSKIDEEYYIEQIKSKQSHLIDKMHQLDNKDVSFILMMDKEINKEDVLEYGNRLKNALNKYVPKSNLYIIGMIKDLKKHKITRVNDGLYLYRIKSLSNNAGDPYRDGDRWGWFKLFKYIKKGKKGRYFLKTNRLIHYLCYKK